MMVVMPYVSQGIAIFAAWIEWNIFRTRAWFDDVNDVAVRVNEKSFLGTTAEKFKKKES